ncbi:glycosyl transferase group 1 [Thermogladius calderae 1633]|uniref:Glycosyl transferase group 1 n=1 Tax=Thermogladius calderae (strain DSM 22663 / VKM B-2946 / 1633) TaxID=1184251 RepID=I3TCX9_THEC1|nr:glycosyltransferase family 4 protein [Thermogladius calderae]AFK50617.1 glycosyl transferase group 1 [Thermogladius calderae 1633]
MKIIHVHHHYWPVIGGLENVVKALAEGMARLGHEVHVVTSTYGAEGRPREEVINGVHIHRVKSIRLGYPDLTYPLEVPRGILRDADVVHGHSQNSLFTVEMIREAKRLGARTVIHFMAVDSFNDHPSRLIRLLAPYYGRWSVRKAIEASDVRLVKSFRDMEILRNRYGIEAEYVPDGVDEGLLRKPNMAVEFRRKFGIQGPLIVYVGRLHKLKGIDVLIRALAIATKKEPSLKAVIAGPGDQRPYRELADKLGISDKVLFTGFVDEDTKVGAIDASIALTLPSVSDHVEVFSLAITEAWAREKPVIASAVGEIPYRVKHMVNGLLVPPGDPKALAEAMIALVQDRELSVRLGMEGRKSVFTWDEIVSKLLNIYTAR